MALVRPPLSAPGVYVQEVPSGVRTITGVSTSLTVFLGRTERGPVSTPTRISSWEEYENTFGGLLADSAMTYAVQDFFLNGGAQAIIIRLFALTKTDNGTTTAQPPEAATTFVQFNPPPTDGKTPVLKDDPKLPYKQLVASQPGTWGQHVSYRTDTTGITDKSAQRYIPAGSTLTTADFFNLQIFLTQADGKTVSVETFPFVSLKPEAGSRALRRTLEQSSDYVRMASTDPNTSKLYVDPTTQAATTGDHFLDGSSRPLPQQTYEDGLNLLKRLDVFNIVCVPPEHNADGSDLLAADGKTLLHAAVYSVAASLCAQFKAALIVDPPAAWDDLKDPTTISPEDFTTQLGISPATPAAEYSAVYYPRIFAADPLQGGAEVKRPASGIIAGIYARTDASRGVWKAPASYTEAGLSGITRLARSLTDDQNGNLNSKGINCLRSFSASGPVVWGARTIAGSDDLSSDFKYIPVRRLTDYIEQTLLRQTRWAVFEPNDEPLWAQIRLAIGSFMNDLFRQGAFQGSSRDQAFFVKCDATTTTQDDINRGIVNVEVGFAPLKPAEFVVLYIEQKAGQTA